MAEDRFDVLVVGAGPAGTACARACAEAGLRTALLDRHPVDALGHPCVVEVLIETLRKCDVPWGRDELAFDIANEVAVMTPSRHRLFRLEHAGTAALRLDRLMVRYVEAARKAGVEVMAPAQVLGPRMDGARVTGVLYAPSGGGSCAIESRIVVDATGNRGELIRQLPRTCGIDFSDRSRDSVIAESRVYAIDAAALDRAVGLGRLEPELVHHVLAAQGTYSTLSYLLSREQGRAFLLAGIKQENTPPGPSPLLDRLVSELDVLGELLFSGRGRIRIRRASSRFVCDGFAAVGEAAGMVVPMHASGVGQGLLAGKSLGEHLARTAGGPITTAQLWPWLAAYQRGLGAIMASYDANRRFLDSLDVDDEAIPLLESGMMNAHDMRATLLSEPLTIPLRTLPSRLRGMVRQPRVAAKVLRAGPVFRLVQRHWSRFPRQWNPGGFRRWRMVANRLLP